MFVLVLVACVVTAGMTAVAVRNQCDLQGGDEEFLQQSLQSSVLGERREITVHLPESYGSTAALRYPVLYVLDGSSHAGHTAESARLLARIGAIPETIIIGIPSSGENRARDYTPPFMQAGGPDEKKLPGQADRFLRFLEVELIPHVERRYRTTGERMLAGNSRGGLFVVYSLLERPALFSSRFAYSPALWRDGNRIVAELESSLRTRLATPSFLYLSLGDGENPKMSSAFRRAVGVLRATSEATPSFRFHADITRKADHGNNAVLSTPVALYRRGRPEASRDVTARTGVPTASVPSSALLRPSRG